MVFEALIRKVVGTSIQGLCFRMTTDSPLLDLIREVQAKGIMMENWKKKRIIGLINRFGTDTSGLFTQWSGMGPNIWQGLSDNDGGGAQV